MRAFIPVLTAAIVATGVGLSAQESNQPAARPTATQAPAARKAVDRSQDEQAIAAVIAAFTKAFDAGNAEAAAATFAEEAIVIDEQGDRVFGRAAIRDQLAATFAEHPGDTIVISTDSLYFFGPAIAIEEGRTTINPAGGGTPELTHYTAVYIKYPTSGWLLSVLREQYDTTLTAHDHLKDLEWMVGDWVNESQDSVVHTTCKWSDDGNFLLREFSMRMQGAPVLSGTQRIGWDPARRQFKAWIFDSEGGFGEGYWTRNGDQWVIKAEGTRQDGLHASATSIITPLGKDRANWQIVDRTIGDLAVPGTTEFTLVRQPPAAGK